MFQILAVEDDKDLNRAVCAFLNSSGYQATGCLDALFLQIGALLRRTKIASSRKLEVGSFAMDAGI